MADFSDMAGYGAVMAALPTAALLRVLREAHDYRPAAVAAAVQELQLRHASGFDIANAVDHGREAACALALADETPLPPRTFIFWMLLPWLVATPLGARGPIAATVPPGTAAGCACSSRQSSSGFWATLLLSCWSAKWSIDLHAVAMRNIFAQAVKKQTMTANFP